MDKFKGTATAEQVCAAVCAGFHETAPEWRCVAVPLADGGDGTVAALFRAGWRPGSVSTIDGQGASVTVDVALRGNTAVIELANICGISRWRGPLDPWAAHTVGVGIAIRECIDAGARHVALAVGGSASTDGGVGVLLGLGFRVTDGQGAAVETGLTGLRSVTAVEPPVDIDTLRTCSWSVLVDVTSPLCGPEGAAHRFGPQKGLTNEEVVQADALLERWSSILAKASGHRVGDMAGTGAAGGVAAPLVALLGARIESGFDFVATQCRLNDHVKSADLVITGEGRVDTSSLSGKVVGEVLSAASNAGVAAVIVAGDVDGQVRSHLPTEVLTLIDLSGDQQEAMARPARYLQQAGRILGQAIAD